MFQGEGRSKQTEKRVSKGNNDSLLYRPLLGVGNLGAGSSHTF